MDPDFYYRRVPQQPPASIAERDLAWKCEVCGYHSLCMDQSGKGLPLEPGPNGKVIPMQCPRCRQEHPHWTPTSPFDAFGDHANLPSALSSRVTHGASIFEAFHRNAIAMSIANNNNNIGSINATPQQGGLLSTSGAGSGSTSASSQNLNHNNNNPSQQGSSASPSSSSYFSSGVIGNLLAQQQQQPGVIGTSSSSNNNLPATGTNNNNNNNNPDASGSNKSRNLVFVNPSTRTEYESLADHDALKDPDVVEALQRLRRRRGAYHSRGTQGPDGDGGGRFANLYASNYGDANRPSTFSSFLFKNNGDGSNTNTHNHNHNNADGLTDEQVSRLPESSLQRAAAHRNTAPKPLECYVCGVCNRRLLRIDHRGELIPIESNAQGTLAAIECPGCHQTHSRWLRVMLNGTSSTNNNNNVSNNYGNYGGGGGGNHNNEDGGHVFGQQNFG